MAEGKSTGHWDWFSLVNDETYYIVSQIAFSRSNPKTRVPWKWFIKWAFPEKAVGKKQNREGEKAKQKYDFK